MAEIQIPIQREIQISKSPVVTGFFDGWIEKDITHITASGPRRCGKTVHIWMLLLWLVEQVPGLKVCILRPEASTLRRTILRTLEDKILKYHPDDPRNPFRLYRTPLYIRFDNGAMIDFIGFDDAGKVQGGEYDVVFFNEIARERTHDRLSDLMATMAGGSAGNLMVKGEKRGLFIGDCNPDSKYHWYYQMYHPESEGGSADGSAWYPFLHTEQPLLYEWDTRRYTGQGKRTIDDLLRAYPPGYNRQRMVYGEWCAAQGAVYDMYNPQRHDVDVQRDDFSVDTEWYLAIDYGFTNPTSVGLWGTENGTHTLFKEIYQTQLTIDDLLAKMEKMLIKYRIPSIISVFPDHDAEHNERLKRAGYNVTLPNKEILPGIDLVKKHLADGTIKFNVNSLIEADPELEGEPQRVTDELLLYAYPLPDERKGTEKDDYPIDKNNHGCDMTRYFAVGKEESLELPEVGFGVYHDRGY